MTQAKGLPVDLNGVSYDELLTGIGQDLQINGSQNIQNQTVGLPQLGTDVNSQLATYQTAAQVQTALGPYETTTNHNTDISALNAAIAAKFASNKIAYGNYTVYFPASASSNTATISPGISTPILACFAISGSGAGIVMSVSLASPFTSFGVNGYYAPGTALNGTFPFFWVAFS